MTGSTGERTVALRDGRSALLRRPRPEDAEALVDFNLAAADDYGNQVPERDEVLTDVPVQREMLDDGAEGPGFLLAAFVEGTLAGTVTLFTTDLAKTRHVAELGLAVRPGFKRLGLGCSLLGAAVERAREAGTSKLVARVFAHNEPALALYLREGFVVEGRQARQYRFRDGTLVDSLWLARFL